MVCNEYIFIVFFFIMLDVFVIFFFKVILYNKFGYLVLNYFNNYWFICI